jgi:hypothetical protein
MRFTLKGQYIFLTGSFTKRGNKRALTQALEAAGAHVTPAINLKTTAMGLGGGHIYTQLERARTRGLTIVSEAQLEEALAQGFVELEDVPAPEPLARDAAIGELRPAVSTPSSEAWNTIVALVDRCPADQLDELLAYIQPQLARWEIPHDARWQPPAEPNRSYYDWLHAQPPGELCGAPLDWITAMMRGEDSAKFGLVQAITLVGMRAKNANLIALLNRPSLTALRVLDMGGGAKLSGSVWAALRTGEATRRLEQLRVTSVSSAHVKHLDGAHHLHALRTLRIGYSSGYVDLGAVDRLLRTSWGSRIETYGVGPLMPSERLAGQVAALDQLRCLELWGYTLYGLARELSALPAVERLALRYTLYAPSAEEFAPILATPLNSVKILDLRSLQPNDQYDSTLSSEAIAQGLINRLPGSALARSVEQVQLGRWWTPELADALTQHNIEVTP